MAHESDKTPCGYCYQPGKIYKVTEGYVKAGTEHLAKPTALCPRCWGPHQQELLWLSHPKGRDFAKKELEDLASEVVAQDRARREAAAPKPPAAETDTKLIAAAVQRLMGEAKRLKDAAPDPRSPAWIGRDLEVEGWGRPVLRKALAQAVEDGDLVLEEFRDEKRNLKRAVRPAPTGVAVKIFA